MLELVISLFVVAIILFAIFYIVSIWIYKRAPSNMGFIRTGFLGTKVCLGKGAIVLPVFHEITWVSLETIKFAVSRAREQAVLTADNIRVDVNTELYAHVGHTEAAVLTASRTLGEKTFDADKVRNLLEAKVVGALRSFAATKTLKQLHENRDGFAREIKEDVSESFAANGLMLEEVTIVALEQSTKEYFRADNVFDAEGLKVITEITSEARRKVHTTEKQTTVAIRNKDLTTQLELLEIERQEAVARAGQDKDIANEQAKQLREKQTFVLDQRLAVEQRELENEKALEQLRTERDIAFTAEAKRREIAQVQKELALEQERRDREIALIDKAREAEIAEITRNLARERAERARDQRHQASEETALSVRKRSLETRLGILQVDRDEAVAAAKQEKEISDERARILSEQQRFVLERRWEVEEEEIRKQQALETAQIQKEIAIIEEASQRETAEVRSALSTRLEEMSRDIALIDKEGERERTDIHRFLAREQAERDREIALVAKTRELEIAETTRLASTAERERAEHGVESVRVVADAERARQIEVIDAGKAADARRIDEESKAAVMRMHMITQSEARKLAAELEGAATLTRARATTEAQKIGAEGIEREAGARGRAEMEVEQLRIANAQRQLEAEATGLEAKAEALKKYNDAATFLELARLRIEAERDVHIDQAKAMGNALSQAQIRMYGNGEGTMDTIRGLFTQGFGIGEVLEGLAQSLPEGLRQRLSANGIQGLLGRPYNGGSLKQTFEHLNALVQEHLRTKKAREVLFPEAIALLGERAGENEDLRQAIKVLAEFNQEGALNAVSFDSVWNMINAVAKSPGANG
jgi:flotillin